MLRNNPGYLGWYSSTLNNHITILQSGDFSVAPLVFCALSENHSPSKTAAAESLCAALRKMSFDDIVRIDEQMRQTTSMEWGINWRNLSINSFFTGMSEEARHAVIVFSSFHPNGFIRENAVHMMKDYDHTLPFIILRLNDWVPQVQNAAGEAADYRLLHLSAGELTAALPFAEKLSRSGRTKKPNKYMKCIYERLISGDNETELATGLTSANIRTRRICTNALFNKESPRYDLAAAQLEHESDPFLRSGIFSRLMSAGYDLDSISERFLLDKYPLNRFLAFQHIRGRDRVQAVLTAKELLLDKSASIRERVRYYLNKNAPGFDYRAHYKNHMSDCTAPAILGLGETGSAADAAEIERYLGSEQVSVARAAMIAVMYLDSEKYTETITDFLSDERVGIVKTARNLVIKTTIPNYTKVMAIFRTTQYMNTKLKCFSILLTARKWQRLIFILDVIEISDNEMRTPAKAALDRWAESYNRSFTAATPAQIEKITESIHRLRGILTLNIRQKLLFY